MTMESFTQTTISYIIYNSDDKQRHSPPKKPRQVPGNRPKRNLNPKEHLKHYKLTQDKQSTSPKVINLANKQKYHKQIP